MTTRTAQSLIKQDNDVTADSCTGQNRIAKLPPLLINQLAAGEVVTRPASVVKELMENAIDAGATEIVIRITQGGMGLIEVSDNGCGIHPDDMIMAVTRFATSKIADIAHLQGISTLGFRGEALAATAAVSRLTLKSSCDDSGIGRELAVAGILEDTPELTPVVQQKGTTVSVKDLYFNVPARRGNLKSIATEFSHIEAVVKQLALVASDITISLWHDDKRRFDFKSIDAYSAGYGDDHREQDAFLNSILCRLQSLLPSLSAAPQGGLKTMVQPIRLSLEGLSAHLQVQDACQVYGVLLPQATFSSKATPKLKLIYINGRLVKDKHIAQCIRECAASFHSDAYQFDSGHSDAITELGYVIFLQLPKSWLNLNVHPSKQHIKIQNLSNITAHLKIGIRSALQTWIKKQLNALDQLPKKTQKENLNAPTSIREYAYAESHRAMLAVQKDTNEYRFLRHADNIFSDIFSDINSNRFARHQSVNRTDQQANQPHTLDTTTTNVEKASAQKNQRRSANSSSTLRCLTILNIEDITNLTDGKDKKSNAKPLPPLLEVLTRFNDADFDDRFNGADFDDASHYADRLHPNSKLSLLLLHIEHEFLLMTETALFGLVHKLAKSQAPTLYTDPENETNPENGTNPENEFARLYQHSESHTFPNNRSKHSIIQQSQTTSQQSQTTRKIEGYQIGEANHSINEQNKVQSGNLNNAFSSDLNTDLTADLTTDLVTDFNTDLISRHNNDSSVKFPEGYLSLSKEERVGYLNSDVLPKLCDYRADDISRYLEKDAVSQISVKQVISLMLDQL